MGDAYDDMDATRVPTARTVEFDIPAKCLTMNQRLHWAQKAKISRLWRDAAADAADRHFDPAINGELRLDGDVPFDYAVTDIDPAASGFASGLNGTVRFFVSL